MRTDPFHFHNGRHAHSVRDLAHIIEESSESIFEEHVNAGRNDFAAWIEHGLHEHALAKRVRLASNRAEALQVLNDWLAPRRANSHPLDVTHQKEFLLGLGVGIIVGVILLRMLQVVLQ